MDGVFGGAATPFSTVAAVHLGSLAEHTGGCFLGWEKERAGSWGLRGLQVCGLLMSQAVPERCHFHVTTGPGVVGWTWGVKSNRLLKRVTPAPLLGGGGWCGRSSHVESHPCFWVWCWIGSGGWVWVGVVGDWVGWTAAGVGSGGAA